MLSSELYNPIFSHNIRFLNILKSMCYSDGKRPLDVGDDGVRRLPPLSLFPCYPQVIYVNHPKAFIASEGNHMITTPNIHVNIMARRQRTEVNGSICSWEVLGSNPSRDPGLQTEVSGDFLQANAGIIRELDHSCFCPNYFKFIIHLS
jgi:hypothetical protein